MKKFTKLALATSVAFSANAMAMQAMDDASLSATTGQDGISIGIGISKITIEKLFVHDNDGFEVDATAVKGVNEILNADGTVHTAGVKAVGVVGGTGKAGAIVIKGNGESGHINQNHGLVIGANYKSLLDSNNLLDLDIDTDAGTGTNGAFLNIAAKVSGLTINIGEIGVTASGTQGAAVNDDNTVSASVLRRGGVATNYNAILSGLEIVTGKMDANIQVGSAPQGAMIKLNTVMEGGLEIKNLGILDNSTKGHVYKYDAVVVPARPEVTDPDTGVTTPAQPEQRFNAATVAAGEIFIESIKIADANANDLTIDSSISVFNDSYVATQKNGPKAHLRIVSNDTGATDQYIKGIHLGNRNAGSIGDMEVQGLQTYYSPASGQYAKGAVITISGR